MKADEIKQLRKRLGCTSRALGRTIGVDQATILSWERGETFPTKRHAEALTELASRGDAAAHEDVRAAAPLAPLGDPETWALFRKLIAHPELRRAALELASRYEDPVAR